jgi:2-dehydropantoate 2-reductase
VIAILGPGGVGGFLAAALARAGRSVTVVAREPTAEVIARDGITVESVRLGEFTAYPSATPRLTEKAAILIVATKFTTLEPALERVRAEPAFVVPLLNGLDHMELLRDRFGDDTVAAGSIRIEAHRPAPGHITQTSPFLRVDVGPPSAQATTFAEALEHAEIPARVDEEPEVLWGKLVRLNALACLTSAYDLPLGPIRDHPAMRGELEACVREAAAVAWCEGADVPPVRVMDELDGAHATLGSSMQRDIAAGIPPELDAIPGAVLRAAERHGVRAPTIGAMYDRIAARVAGGG